jgi:hypothetical protein
VVDRTAEAMLPLLGILAPEAARLAVLPLPGDLRPVGGSPPAPELAQPAARQLPRQVLATGQADPRCTGTTESTGTAGGRQESRGKRFPALSRSMAWRAADSMGVRSYWLAMKPTTAGGAKGKSLP